MVTDLRLLSLLEEGLLALGLALLSLCEVALGGHLVYHLRVDALNVDDRAGTKDISVVHASQRNAVDFEGPSNEKSAAGELLED
jgi:hypothetical protein